MPKQHTLPTQPNFPQMEEDVLAYWQDTQAFEKSVEMRPNDKAYVFYDGPPFATGLPHYGHLLGSTSKDVIPRYWTMKGYRVERVWGWDCHGLPIENMIEKKLDIKGGKKGIEELGIDKFNQACEMEVLRLDTEWEKIIARLGRWVDFKNNYKTMDATFMESVWWGFKQLFDKGLIYEGRKVVMYCPRCSTPLSNFEIAMDNSYEDVSDHSVYVKFKVVDATDEYLVAWTTTPWTLPGNVGLAVDTEADYVQVEQHGQKLWAAKALAEKVFIEDYKVLKTVKGSELIGLHYEPLYDYVQSDKPNAWSVLAADFVSLEDGTGIVHTAAIFGEDDYALALEADLPLVPTLNDEGKFLDFVEIVAGKFYKGAEKTINADLEERGLMHRAEKITHSYPFCYRCNTPLYYNAVPAWFINVQKLKDDLIAQNENINWFPEHLKYGRFGKGLETAPDWNISRSRYWGTPLPVWRSKDGDQRVIGSVAELKEWAVDSDRAAQVENLHREYLDDIEVWVDDDKTIKGTRIPEVFDCWVESGSMPFASKHYPFENKEEFESTYPAQFVSEYIAQTRAWFYTMHVMSVGVFGKNAVENTLTTGTILAEDGTKMSKSKKNYPDPMTLINEYGVDSLRLYLMSSTVMKSENLNFNEREVSDIRKKVFVIWYNMVSFFKLYAGDATVNLSEKLKPEDIMDRWIMSRLAHVTKEVTEYMDAYNVVKASRTLMSFVDEVSTWYLRRSRDRLRTNQESVKVFGIVLVRLAQLFAPFTPFFSEWLYQHLVTEDESIHHTDWPTADESAMDAELEESMEAVRKVVAETHAQRREAGIKVRQPLPMVTAFVQLPKPADDVLQVLLDEVNVKDITWNHSTESLTVKLETELTDQLKAEGEARELMRSIQRLRKKANLSFDTAAVVTAPEWPTNWQSEIEEKTNVTLEKGGELALKE
ncbi:MAG: isoleucine--tRNA ligase [Pseudomonadales bacterium]|nr:isoleucine--tRNA ligase [Pseudomonadales bacterium]